MSASKSRQKRSKQPSAPKRLAFWCSLNDGYGHAEYKTLLMRPRAALQQMQDVVREMRAIMRLGKIHSPVGEPQWLTDAV